MDRHPDIWLHLILRRDKGGAVEDLVAFANFNLQHVLTCLQAELYGKFLGSGGDLYTREVRDMKRHDDATLGGYIPGRSGLPYSDEYSHQKHLREEGQKSHSHYGKPRLFPVSSASKNT
jgi:hypothetical protein